MSTPRASIVLPTLNGERDLARLLPALARQELEGGFELLAIDSGSTDRTRELLQAAGASVERIERREFRHGPTRNRCAARAKAPFLVFLSQDAVPRDPDFLARLLAAFDDERVAGAYARILPHPDDDPLTARTVLDAREARAEPMEHVWRPDPREQPSAHVHFNNVASAIRADVFREFPFPDAPFGEDLAWATRVFVRGWRIRFAPEAVVLHSHRYGLRSAYARYKVDAAFHRRFDGGRVRPSLWSVLRGLAHEVRRDVAFVRTHGGGAHLLRAPFLRAAQVLGQWRGTNAAPGPEWAGLAPSEGP
jgi:rhamnosyltransferase